MPHNDIFHKCTKDRGPIGSYQERIHGYFTFPKLEGPVANRMKFRGKEKIVWSINNYLGLANHPEVRLADRQAAQEFGLAVPMGARMMTGNTPQHEAFERELADFVQKPAVFLLNYGYQGIMSVIDCICSRHDVIVYDAEDHASIIDGLRLHVGQRYVFKHNDIEDCEKQLQRAQAFLAQTNSNGGILVITEGVFGMAGDQGKLREIAALKKKYNFRLLVDDAHGFGTIGQTGAGTGEHQGCQADIDLYFATFAKSMASIGAFIAGPKEVIDFVRYNSRSQLYAKSLPMPLLIGNQKRLEMIRAGSSLRECLWTNVRLLQDGLRASGMDIGKTNSAVTPVYMRGSIDGTLNMAIDLRENHDVFCSVVVYPVIPKGQVIYRIIPTAVHTADDIQQTIEAFRQVKKKLDAGLYENPFVIPA